MALNPGWSVIASAASQSVAGQSSAPFEPPLAANAGALGDGGGNARAPLASDTEERRSERRSDSLWRLELARLEVADLSERRLAFCSEAARTKASQHARMSSPGTSGKPE